MIVLRLSPSGLSMTRNAHDLAEKIATSTSARRLAATFSTTTCRCSIPAESDSDSAERIFHPASAGAASGSNETNATTHRARKTSQETTRSTRALRFAVFRQQAFETRIASQ